MTSDDVQLATLAVSLTTAVVAILLILDELGAISLGSTIVVTGVVSFAQLVRDVVVVLNKS